MKSFLFSIVALLLLSCSETSHKPSDPERQITDTALNETQLIAHVQKAIDPRFRNWVLFTHGTYIVLPDSSAKDAAATALQVMKRYGPVSIGSPAGDFSVTELSQTEGWAVGFDYEGMYTYVHPDDLGREGILQPSDAEVGLYGRKRRGLDAQDLKIIFVHQ